LSQSRIQFEVVESKALSENALGDPHVRHLPIYLPPEYEDTKERYPLVFLLASFTHSGVSLMNQAAWEETIQQRMDRLISTKRCRPMLLAMPDCLTRYGGSQYINSPATGRYADYLLELVEYVDAHFRTIADRNYRAVAGISSGGYGALMTAMHHPEIFALAADHSGDKYFELCYKPDFPEFLRAVQDYAPLETMLADPSLIRPRGPRFHTFMGVIAMAACYSPNPDAPLGFDLPLDPQTGLLRPEIWERWLAHDPVMQVTNHLEALRSLRLLYFDCGRHDEYNIQFGCRILHRILLEHAIPHVYEEFDDGHRSIQYRYDTSLARISNAMPQSSSIQKAEAEQ
jgi:hypothetical protein